MLIIVIRGIMKSQKGVSPLIASVLLIAFTMAIAAILTAWISSFTTAQKEKIVVYEGKIDCSAGMIEEDKDFTQYNATDGLFKVRVRNVGTIDVSIGKYTVWYDDSSVPIMWDISNPTNYTIQKQDDRIIILNVSGSTIPSKVKLIGFQCEGVWATIIRPASGWVPGNFAATDSSFVPSIKEQ